MASKTKRRSVSTSVETNVEEVKPTAKSSTRTFSAPDFTADINYVKQDLKHIAYLAAAFFVILIVLSFILR
jgi:hypothetical protein